MAIHMPAPDMSWNRGGSHTPHIAPGSMCASFYDPPTGPQYRCGCSATTFKVGVNAGSPLYMCTTHYLRSQGWAWKECKNGYAFRGTDTFHPQGWVKAAREYHFHEFSQAIHHAKNGFDRDWEYLPKDGFKAELGSYKMKHTEALDNIEWGWYDLIDKFNVGTLFYGLGTVMREICLSHHSCPYGYSTYYIPAWALQSNDVLRLWRLGVYYERDGVIYRNGQPI